jgi:integrase
MDVKNGIDNGKTGKRQFDLFKPVSVRPGGERIESANWAVRFQFEGKRTCRSLGTPDFRLAQQRAKALVQKVRGHGWQAVTKLRGDQDSILIEDLITRFKASAPGRGLRPKSIEDFVSALKQVAAGVNAKRVADLKPERVQTFLADMDTRPATVVSLIRNARAVFAPKSLRAMDLAGLPNPLAGLILPKQDVESFNAPSREWIQNLMTLGTAELNGPARLGFALALGCGLRWGEIASLTWECVLDDRVRVLAGLAKGRRQRDIPFGPIVKVILDAARQPSGLVVPTPTAVHQELTAWLRTKGIKDQKPLHYLRKLFGSLAVADHGLFIGSKLLGHRQVELTARVYANLIDQLPSVNF